MTWLLAAASLTATWLNVRKLRASFAIWFFTNVAWAAYDFAHGHHARGLLMSTYAALAVAGYVSWGRKGGA